VLATSAAHVRAASSPRELRLALGRDQPRSREQAVIQLLRTLDLALMGDGGGVGRADRFDDRILRFGELYKEGSYAELERVLREMRTGWTLTQPRRRAAQVRQHALGRYRWSERRYRPVRALKTGLILVRDGDDYRLPSAGEAFLSGITVRHTPHGPQPVCQLERWERWVRQELADHGVREIARRMRGPIRVPDSLL
jgi:hypothetical protein